MVTAELTDCRFHQSTLPLPWKSVLEDINQFYQTVVNHQSYSSHSMTPDMKMQLKELHHKILLGSEQLVEGAVIEDVDEQELEFLLAKSLLILQKLEKNVGMHVEVFDSYGSKALDLYQPGISSKEVFSTRVDDYLQNKLRLEEKALKALNDQVERFTAKIAAKTKLLAALKKIFKLSPKQSDLSQNVFRFFDAFYPGSGFRVGDVEVIVTGVSIFFCLKFDPKTNEPTCDWISEASADEKNSCLEFLKRLAQFKQDYFAHFPVFGFFKGRNLDQSLLEALAQASGMTTDKIARELTTSVTILPYKEVDKYLVHDVWGHGAQSGMLSFNEMYQEIAYFDEPLHLQEKAKLSDGTELALKDVFTIVGGKVEFNGEAFRDFVDAEISERLPIALSPVIAELMADLVEHKLLEDVPELKKDLKNSSLFAAMPAKLDLTLTDSRFYFLQATKLFRNWIKYPEAQQKFVEQLVKQGAQQESAEKAVNEACSEWLRLERQFYQTEIDFQVKQNQLLVNGFSRVVLNFVSIYGRLVKTYPKLSSMSSQSMGLKDFKDLLIIASSVFFERDRRRNLWRLDEFLGSKIIPMCELIGENQ